MVKALDQPITTISLKYLRGASHKPSVGKPILIGHNTVLLFLTMEAQQSPEMNRAKSQEIENMSKSVG